MGGGWRLSAINSSREGGACFSLPAGLRPALEFLHFQGRGHIEMWGRLSTCGRLSIGLALDHGNSSGVPASPAVTYRVPLDVMNHALKLRIVANQPIIALILPEWLASESQHSVALPGSESFERLHHLGNCLQWSHQEMNVVRHNDKRMELI